MILENQRVQPTLIGIILDPADVTLPTELSQDWVGLVNTLHKYGTLLRLHTLHHLAGKRDKCKVLEILKLFTAVTC
jgi:hypothetical protein